MLGEWTARDIGIGIRSYMAPGARPLDNIIQMDYNLTEVSH